MGEAERSIPSSTLKLAFYLWRQPYSGTDRVICRKPDAKGIRQKRRNAWDRAKFPRGFRVHIELPADLLEDGAAQTEFDDIPLALRQAENREARWYVRKTGGQANHEGHGSSMPINRYSDTRIAGVRVCRESAELPNR
jgi:hypothetical protein